MFGIGGMIGGMGVPPVFCRQHRRDAGATNDKRTVAVSAWISGQNAFHSLHTATLREMHFAIRAWFNLESQKPLADRQVHRQMAVDLAVRKSLRMGCLGQKTPLHRQVAEVGSLVTQEQDIFEPCRHPPGRIAITSSSLFTCKNRIAPDSALSHAPSSEPDTSSARWLRS